MKGNITRDGNAVATDIEVDVHITKQGGLLEWSGSFSTSHSVVFDDNEYTLELADGRSGRILIYGAGISGSFSLKHVRFQGTGPLELKKAV